MSRQLVTIPDLIKRAMTERNPALAAPVADFLRFKKGMTQKEIETIVKVCGADARDWEALMYEVDTGY